MAAVQSSYVAMMPIEIVEKAPFNNQSPDEPPHADCHSAEEPPSDQALLYWEALSSLEGFGNKTLLTLLAKAGSVQAVWNAPDALLRELLPERKRERFLRRRDQGVTDGWLETHRKLGVQVIVCTDPRYPRLLREIHDPPCLLYVKGNIKSLSSKTMAVVGTRNATEYGRQVAEKLVRELKPSGITVISGLAAGIDTVAHWAALQSGLPTVAVFGCGLDIIAPSTNRRLSQEILAHDGALVSEYKLGTPASKYTFPQRNRIVAGLSHGVLVIEGDVKSGALITAKLGLEEGRTVFAVPGNIYSPGSQGPMFLIRNGAVPVTCGEDILQELHWWNGSDGKAEKSSRPDESLAEAMQALSQPEHQVLEGIPHDPVLIEDLSQTIGLPFAKINEILTLLELEGLIVLMPGAKVCRR